MPALLLLLGAALLCGGSAGAELRVIEDSRGPSIYALNHLTPPQSTTDTRGRGVSYTGGRVHRLHGGVRQLACVAASGGLGLGGGWGRRSLKGGEGLVHRGRSQRHDAMG